ncbi:MAG TPA: endonuclease/exonuclease/phosphatase family protein [Verrucomicrobiae bacterium]|jgi:endonuclease/exonuclease/phosphatase family metal-dependent hydrolase|nr:endonuclease/exonuclease/phosphatase family protein [Verrucomicrobiae bacterium]
MIKQFKLSALSAIVAGVLISITGAGCKTASEAAGPVTLRVMTYNIQHGAGADNKIDFARTAAAINAEHPDIVALEEVDKGVQRTDRRDLTAELAALTGLTGYFSNNFNFQGGEYGNAILTRFPILQQTNTHYVMIRPKEQRGIIQLILDVHGHKVLFMTTHIDYRRENEERLLNVGEIKRIIQQYPGLPMILCGDFNDFPQTPVYNAMRESFDDTWALVGQGNGWTFPSPKPNRRIDYIWLSPDKSIEPLKAWVPDTQASDHRPLVADLRIK